MMKKLIPLFLILFSCWAFYVPGNDSFPEQFMKRMLEFVSNRPQEKVYLHTDRDHYDAGDKVWFRAYLTNASNHTLSPLSRYVYVELRDRQDSLYSRIKIGYRDSVFAGYMPLPKQLPQGDYFLRAYSYWMQNAGDDYIFRKKIRVINPQDSKVLTEVTYEDKGDGATVRIRFFNSRREAYGKVFVKWTWGEKSRVDRTDDNGCIEIKVDTTRKNNKIKVRFSEEDPFPFERYVYLPDSGNDFEVDFLPEGGELLSGCSQLVAFKAIGPDGLSREVSGWLCNDRDEQLLPVRSLHKGMGAFDLEVKPGERYYALLYTSDSIPKRFDLPDPDHYALALKVMQSRELLGFSVLAADSARIPEDLYVVMQCRGVPLMCTPVAAGGQGKVSLDGFPEGITEVLLMDGNATVYSRRLFFVKKARRPEIAVTTDKLKYNIRDEVHLNLQLVADSSYDRKGSFSIAVTDDGKCDRDSLQGNIISELLLSSDLKGYVEDPGFYFRDNRISTRTYLNLLMLTQGWSRFKVENTWHHKYDTNRYYLERGQAISGRVKNFWGKDAMNANLILLSTGGLVRMVNADSSGYFTIDGIAFPDSTKFVVQGKSKRGRRTVEVLMDEDEYLLPSKVIPYGAKEWAEEAAFYEKFKKDYYYDNGVKVYVLDEAVVKRRKEKKVYSFYDNMADYNLDSARLAAMGDRDIRQVLQELPGVDAFGDSIKRFGKVLQVMVNDFEEDLDRVWMLSTRDLVSISLVLPPTSRVMFGERASNGALIITTNPNYVPKDRPRPNLTTFSLLGYQKKAVFYMPHYEVDSVRRVLADSLDHRVTVYWNPVIETDERGRASCFFTTSDSDGPYSVIIEGILKDGTICRKEQKIRLK